MQGTGEVDKALMPATARSPVLNSYAVFMPEVDSSIEFARRVSNGIATPPF
jgi:hypothetical protein